MLPSAARCVGERRSRRGGGRSGGRGCSTLERTRASRCYSTSPSRSVCPQSLAMLMRDKLKDRRLTGDLGKGTEDVLEDDEEDEKEGDHEGKEEHRDGFREDKSHLGK